MYINRKIFISHCSKNSEIGEIFVECLTSLGIPASEIFYSSNTYTGVKNGEIFTTEIKKNLETCERIIFLITKDFYESVYCLNEMGAAWILSKPSNFILLDNLNHKDMKGFFDSSYCISCINDDSIYALLENLQVNFSSSGNTIKNVQKAYTKLKEALDNQNMNTSKNKLFLNEISDIENKIINKCFTEDEILVLNYFIDKQTSEVACGEYIIDSWTTHDTSFFIFNTYANQYNINNPINCLEILREGNILSKSIIDNKYSSYKLSFDKRTELNGLSKKTKTIIDNLKKQRQNTINSFFWDSKYNILLFNYMIDNNEFKLGDRSKREQTLKKIVDWENKKEIYNVLSKNYEETLNNLIKVGVIEPFNFTKYNNPNEWQLTNIAKNDLIFFYQSNKSLFNKTILSFKY